MKIKYMFIAGCLLLTSACSDFLDHPLTTSVSDDNIGEIIQRNPTKLGEFLGSAYRSLGSIHLLWETDRIYGNHVTRNGYRLVR